MKRVAIALFVLFQLAAALVVAGPVLAQAVPVTDLIEERAVAELGGYFARESQAGYPHGRGDDQEGQLRAGVLDRP